MGRGRVRGRHLPTCTPTAFFKASCSRSGAVIHRAPREQDMRADGGLKGHLPLQPTGRSSPGRSRVAGVCRAGRLLQQVTRSCTEVLGRTTRPLWTIGAVTSLLRATYMFRLVVHDLPRRPRFAAPAAATATAGHGHDAPGVHPARRAARHGHPLVLAWPSAGVRGVRRRSACARRPESDRGSSSRASILPRTPRRSRGWAPGGHGSRRRTRPATRRGAT